MDFRLYLTVVLCLSSGLWITTKGDGDGEAGDCVKKCPSGWTVFEDRCFRFLFREREWGDAEKYCTYIGGNLASIQSADEYTFLRDMVYEKTNSHRKIWVGGTDAGNEGVWLWSDGKPFVFTRWGKGEPNNSGDEDCMEIIFGDKDFVNDQQCHHKRSFVCARYP